MEIRVLFATPDENTEILLYSLIASARQLVCFDLAVADVAEQDEMLAAVDDHTADVVLLDWSMAGDGTPDLVSEILVHNPKMRVVVLLPLIYRQYRDRVWQAGACNSIPKEHMEQEWFSSILCVMHRAMEREARLIREYETRLTAERCQLDRG
ncbi:MAG: response regulator transcription factor [Caldilineaceae bacterium]|nr:response regulator transcription factor [Caldilineaceae bacterium]